MTRALRYLVLIVLVCSAFGVPLSALAATAQSNVAEPYIVTLAPNVNNFNALVAQTLARSGGFSFYQSYDSAIKGFAARLTPSQVQFLQASPQVVSIQPDLPTHITGQTIPTGVERIGTSSNGTASIDGTNNSLNIDVATLDTGVDPTQPDLNVAGGFNAMATPDNSGNFTTQQCDGSTSNGSWADDNGHGTHVAGTIAAIDNNTGVVGVAPGARIWAVKVFDANGNGSVSSIICGINWVIAHASTIKAVNFSGAWSGTSTPNCGTEVFHYENRGTIKYPKIVKVIDQPEDAAHEAVCNMVNTYGIPFIVAAGNDGQDASNTLPAAYPEVISVGAIADSDGLPGGHGATTSYGKDDTRASFSNYGPDVTIYAPGVNILSTWPLGNKNDNANGTSGLNIISGTSMATPHVTGAVLLYRLNHPSATPAQIKSALVANGEAGSWGSPYGSQPLLNVSNAAFGGAPPTPTHDVEVSTITTLNPAYDGVANTVVVHVTNSGNQPETNLSVSLTDNTNPVGTSQSVPGTLNPGDGADIDFSWTPSGTGSHTLAATVSNTNTSHSNSTSVNVSALVHDVQVTSVTVPSQVTQGQSATVSVAVKNIGSYSESNISVSLSSSPSNGAGDPSAQTIALGVGQSTTVNFNWVTTGSTTKQAYTLTGHASISPETDNTPTNNNLAGSNQISVVAPPSGQNIWVTGLTGSPLTGTKTFHGQVTISNASGTVSGAVVLLTVTGPSTNSMVQATTSSSGVANYAYTASQSGTYTVTVSNVTHGADTYTPGKNSSSSVSIRIR